MAKDTFYFSHDYNSRNDSKIKKLLAKYGYAGYGLFWAIIEDLYNNTNVLRLDYDTISFDLRSTPEIVKSLIHDFDLFEIDKEYFGSLSVQRRLNERNAKSEKARKSVLLRWNKNKLHTNVLQKNNDSNTIKESKVKESKGKENKRNNNSIVETSSTNDVNNFPKEKTAFTPKSVNAKLPTVKKEKGAGAEATPKSPSPFTACIEVYNQFMIQRTGLPGKFDGQEGKGMVAIVAYLASVSIEKTDQGTINSWRHILSLIEKWDPYHKNQLKLSQINSNLINIINSIKNGNSKQINNSYSTNKYRTPTGQQPV